MIDEGFKTSKYTLNLLFKGSRDGFKSKECKKVCKNYSNTLLVVESEHGSIFGGFSSQGRYDNNIYFCPDDGAWIFSLTNRTVHRQHYYG